MSLYFNRPNCKNNPKIMNDAIRILKLFLNDEYVSLGVKKEIYSYLNKTNYIS